MMDFSFLEELRALSVSKQEQFQRVVSRLLNGQVLSPGDRALRSPDPDWMFLSSHRGLVDGWMRVGGFRVDFHGDAEIARAAHIAGEHQARFDLNESLVVCVLRQIYHEQMSSGVRDSGCVVRIDEIRERIAVAGHGARLMSAGAALRALKRLARHRLVRLDPGFAGDDHDEVRVEPLIEKVLTPDQITRYFEELSGAAAREDLGEEQPAGQGTDAQA